MRGQRGEAAGALGAPRRRAHTPGRGPRALAPHPFARPPTRPPSLSLPSAGQWVAWKQLGDKAAAGGDLFVADSFYNLLCPQRPSTL